LLGSSSSLMLCLRFRVAERRWAARTTYHSTEEAAAGAVKVELSGRGRERGMSEQGGKRARSRCFPAFGVSRRREDAVEVHAGHCQCLGYTVNKQLEGRRTSLSTLPLRAFSMDRSSSCRSMSISSTSPSCRAARQLRGGRYKGPSCRAAPSEDSQRGPGCSSCTGSSQSHCACVHLLHHSLGDHHTDAPRG